MIAIPYDELRADTLRALVEEFITREGAVHGHADATLERSVSQVLAQLAAGLAIVVFDEASESCTIVSKQSMSAAPAEEPRIDDEG